MAQASVRLDTAEMVGWAKGAKNAPKVVASAIRQEHKRGGNRFRTQARKTLLLGPPGIFLPANTFTKGRKKSPKKVQERHIIVKSGGKKVLFLAAYTSKFLTYHSERIASTFVSLFRKQATIIAVMLKSEIPRRVKVELEKGVKKARRTKALT